MGYIIKAAGGWWILRCKIQTIYKEVQILFNIIYWYADFDIETEKVESA